MRINNSGMALPLALLFLILLITLSVNLDSRISSSARSLLMYEARAQLLSDSKRIQDMIFTRIQTGEIIPADGMSIELPEEGFCRMSPAVIRWDAQTGEWNLTLSNQTASGPFTSRLVRETIFVVSENRIQLRRIALNK